MVASQGCHLLRQVFLIILHALLNGLLVRHDLPPDTQAEQKFQCEICE